MTSKIFRRLQGLIFLGLGGLLFQLFITGKLYYYINERFFYLVILAAVGFFIFGAVALAKRAEPASECAHADCDHDDHHHETVGRRWSVGIVAIPLLLGFLIPAKPLDANIIQSRGISNDALLTASGAQQTVELNQPADQRSILDWVRSFNFSEDPTEFEGETADVIGFVYHDPRLPDSQFLIGRLAITCCVADAFAIGMAVEWPAAAEMPDNAWVHVRGEVAVVEVGGKTIPLIRADSVKDTAAPPQPYLFP